jgi:hypothetical protein
MAERIARLPVWARKHIERLVMRLAEARKDRDDTRTHEPSRLVVGSQYGGLIDDSPAPPHFADERRGVFMSLDSDRPDKHTTWEEIKDWNGIQLRIRKGAGGFAIVEANSARGALQVHGGSTNQLYLTCDDRPF